MSSSLVALKLLGPGAAVVVAAAAVAGGEAFGLDIGAAELGGGALALFLLREVFNFVKWHTARKDPPAPTEIALPVVWKDHLLTNERLLNEIRKELHEQRRVCLLADVNARDHFIEALERALTRAGRRWRV